MEHLCTPTDSLLESRSAYRTDHKLLEADRCVRVSTAVDDIHHRHWKNISVCSAYVAVERHIEIVGGSFCYGKRHAEDGVCTEIRLGGSAVESEHDLVNADLVERAVAFESLCDRTVHIGYSLLNALAHITALVAVTKFESLVLASRSTARHCCAAHNAAFKDYVYLYCRIAARIKYFATDNFFNSHVLINFYLGFVNFLPNFEVIKMTCLIHVSLWRDQV